MSRGADLFALDAAQYSILHRSLWSTNKEMTKNMLDYFHEKGLKSELDRLLQIPEESGNTCLHSACLSGRSDLACILVDKGADLKAANSQGETALHMACRTVLCPEKTAERKKIVEHLISKGASINAQDHSGKTALHFAASKDSLLLVECLLNNKADVNVQNMKGDTPLHLAHKTDVINFLVKSGASKDVQGGFALTPNDNHDNEALLLVE